MEDSPGHMNIYKKKGRAVMLPTMLVSQLPSRWSMLLVCHSRIVTKQGRIHGRTVVDGWAGAILQKPLVTTRLQIFKLLNLNHHGLTDGPMEQRNNKPMDGQTKPVLELRVRN